MNGDTTIYYDPRRASQTFHAGMQALRRHTVVAPHPNQAGVMPPNTGLYNYAFEVYTEPSPAPEHLSYMS